MVIGSKEFWTPIIYTALAGAAVILVAVAIKGGF